MQLTDVLRTQIETAHGTMMQVIEDLTDEQLHHCLPGATINSIASVFVHIVIAEDRFTHTLLQGKPRLFDDGWGERLGLTAADRDHQFESFHMRDRAAFLDYTNAVFADTEKYLASAGSEDLDRLVKLREREMPVGVVLARLLAGHALQHTGEMAALKGAMGLKGLAF